SVCIPYAKSKGIEPDGSSMTSPLGVNTYTISENKSIFNDSTNSSASCVSFCQSKISLNQDNLSLKDFPLGLILLPSLYAQCAAIPYSAICCISFVLICTSNGSPCGPITVV